MPIFELWINETFHSGTMAGYFDCAEELKEMCHCSCESIVQCEVYVLNHGVPSNWLPELETLPLAELLKRGNRYCCDDEVDCALRGNRKN